MEAAYIPLRTLNEIACRILENLPLSANQAHCWGLLEEEEQDILLRGNMGNEHSSRPQNTRHPPEQSPRVPLTYEDVPVKRESGLLNDTVPAPSTQEATNKGRTAGSADNTDTEVTIKSEETNDHSSNGSHDSDSGKSESDPSPSDISTNSSDRGKGTPTKRKKHHTGGPRKHLSPTERTIEKARKRQGESFMRSIHKTWQQVTAGQRPVIRPYTLTRPDYIVYLHILHLLLRVAERKEEPKFWEMFKKYEHEFTPEWYGEFHTQLCVILFLEPSHFRFKAAFGDKKAMMQATTSIKGTLHQIPAWMNFLNNVPVQYKSTAWAGWAGPDNAQQEVTSAPSISEGMETSVPSAPTDSNVSTSTAQPSSALALGTSGIDQTPLPPASTPALGTFGYTSAPVPAAATSPFTFGNNAGHVPPSTGTPAEGTGRQTQAPVLPPTGTSASGDGRTNRAPVTSAAGTPASGTDRPIRARVRPLRPLPRTGASPATVTRSTATGTMTSNGSAEGEVLRTLRTSPFDFPVFLDDLKNGHPRREDVIYLAAVMRRAYLTDPVEYFPYLTTILKPFEL